MFKSKPYNLYQTLFPDGVLVCETGNDDLSSFNNDPNFTSERKNALLLLIFEHLIKKHSIMEGWENYGINYDVESDVITIEYSLIKDSDIRDEIRCILSKFAVLCHNQDL